MPPWWFDQYGEPLNEDRGVSLIDQENAEYFKDKLMDLELRMLEQYLEREAKSRHDLEAVYGDVWDESEVQLDFELLGSSGPFVIARSKHDGALGSLVRQKNPAYYFSWDTKRVI